MDAPTDEPEDLRATAPRRGYVLAVGVLLVALTLVFAAWLQARAQQRKAAEAEFVGHTGEVIEQLRQRLLKYELVARGGASLFATVARPTPRQWRDYVDGMSIGRRFPGLAGLGFAGYIPGPRLVDLQTEWRQAGYGQLDVRPHGIRPAYGPILYLEPRTMENVAAIGYDMYAEPVRRAAMVAALETGEARLTGRVRLVQDPGGERSGMLMYLPVYAGGGVPGQPAARRAQAQGWVYLPFYVDEFVEAALGESNPGMRFRIVDVTGGASTPLHRQGPALAEGEAPAFVHHAPLDVYGRSWRVEFQSGPLHEAAPDVGDLRNLLLLGIFVALLLFALAWTLAQTEYRANRIAGRMTEEFRRSERRFRSAMNYSAIGKALLDSDGRIVEANPSLGRIVGRAPESMVGLRFDGLFEDDGGVRVDDARERVDVEGVRRLTRRLRHQHGAPRQAQLTYAPVPGSVGQDIAELVQVEDVTERLRAEARVHALNRTLEARVALRTRELSHANQELEAFAYSVSHDLRAPLRAIDGFSRILVERYQDVLDEAGRDYLGRVRSAAGRMGELIDAMLKMSRVGRSAINPEPVDLGRIAQELVDELRMGEPERPVEARIASGLQAHGDPTLLRNLMENLVGNAWKFSAGKCPAVIEVGSQPCARGGVEYFVRDNGAGFPQEYVEKLFRPFQRLHAQGEFAGHGIGLASVRRIVERHGGTIRAEGREGEGATFYFTLPDSDDHA